MRVGPLAAMEHGLQIPSTTGGLTGATWFRNDSTRRISMLGERISAESGKVTAQRVLPNPGGGPKMETSFQATGTILGVNEADTGTYWSVLRPDGTLYGEGQGILMGQG